MIKNYGLDLERELAEQSEKDWIFGATSLVCIAEIPPTERIVCLPKGEVQQSNKTDMMDCATRGPNNIIETKLNWLIKNGKMPSKALNFLKQYMNNEGKVELSDAFTAIKSGTTMNGNSMKAPLEAIRTCGIVPKKLLPLLSWHSWTDYHNPNRITPEIEAIGKESLKYFNFNYERVLPENIKNFLQRDILNLAGFAWPEPIKGIYPKTFETANHVFMGLDNDNLIKYQTSNTDVFDNYIDPWDGDFIKKLAPDYEFYGQYRVIITINIAALTEEEHIEVLQKEITILERLILLYQQLIDLKNKLKVGVMKIFKH
jgi:hypothetical protein